MDERRYLEFLKEDGEALASAAERDLHAHVPSCPEWDVAQLVRHTGRVHRHKMEIVRRGGTQPPEDIAADEGPESQDELIEWYRAGLNELVSTLSAADGEASAWSWSGDHRVAFWVRRMAQETAVHRWDAENAVGRPGAIDPELAADGVDEMLGVFIPAEGLPYEGPKGTLHLLATDAPGEWTVTLRPGAVPTYASGSSDADAAIAGTAEELLLWVWRRIELGRLETDPADPVVAGFYGYLEGPGQ